MLKYYDISGDTIFRTKKVQGRTIKSSAFTGEVDMLFFLQFSSFYFMT